MNTLQIQLLAAQLPVLVRYLENLPKVVVNSYEDYCKVRDDVFGDRSIITTENLPLSLLKTLTEKDVEYPALFRVSKMILEAVYEGKQILLVQEKYETKVVVSK